MENTNNEQQHMDLLDEMMTASAAEPVDLSCSVRDLTLAVKKALEEIAVRIFLFSTSFRCISFPSGSLFSNYFVAFPFVEA
jgi:hypothetical protein